MARLNTQRSALTFEHRSLSRPLPVLRLIVTLWTSRRNFAAPAVGGGGGTAAKTALTLRAVSRVTVQVAAAPEQSPVQPAKVEPAAGVALSVTCDPRA